MLPCGDASRLWALFAHHSVMPLPHGTDRRDREKHPVANGKGLAFDRVIRAHDSRSKDQRENTLGVRRVFVSRIPKSSRYSEIPASEKRATSSRFHLHGAPANWGNPSWCSSRRRRGQPGKHVHDLRGRTASDGTIKKVQTSTRWLEKKAVEFSDTVRIGRKAAGKAPGSLRSTPCQIKRIEETPLTDK